MSKRDYEHISGCLLGGAVGDALGAPVEFLSLKDIRARFGPDGIQNYAPAYGKLGAITDDTQMALFTAEGLLRHGMRRTRSGPDSCVDSVHKGYLRWLATQDGIRKDAPQTYNGWLFSHDELHSRRAPGHSCLSALQSGKAGRTDIPVNNSKGCGGIMRAAPAGLFGSSYDPFHTGCEIAAITHGHPSGYLTAGFLARMIADIIDGADLMESIEHSREVLQAQRGHEECLRAVNAALLMSQEDASPENVEKLGEGWVAEESLAISLFCALKARDFMHGVCLAVNHSGDSDSTGAITGNILGAYWGITAIPNEFLDDLELADVISEISRDIVICDFSDPYLEKYPVL